MRHSADEMGWPALLETWHTPKKKRQKKPIFTNLKKRLEHIELPAKLLDNFLRSNKSNINSIIRRKDRGVVCVFSIFNPGGSVCGCMRVYTHTHTHTAQMGYSVVNKGVGMRHLEGPKNTDGLNLGIYVFMYVYTIHMCMYMLEGEMRS